jgi:FtsP/CotA-like multicopper oxidase with cupredoxin domain
MRMDIVVRAPAGGASAEVVDHFAPEPVALATLVGAGTRRRTAAFDPAPLRAGRIPEPDLASAERMRFSASATAVDQPAPLAVGLAAGAPLGVLCTPRKTFWAINQQSWPAGDHSSLPPPLATLEHGRSYIFELENQTPNVHPLHIHGHTFKVLRYSRQDLPVHHADTILLQPKETVEVAFVADNPGDWMFHCHIIEHQETGMMGYIRVA